MAFMTYIGSEFSSSHWIEWCCTTVRDVSGREKLRQTLERNFSHANKRRAPAASIRGAIRDFVRAFRERLSRDSWTTIYDPGPEPYYRVDVKTTVTQQFAADEWALLRRIEMPD
jgi:hypothetical protein